jgi:hypothetical protein
LQGRKGNAGMAKQTGEDRKGEVVQGRQAVRGKSGRQDK